MIDIVGIGFVVATLMVYIGIAIKMKAETVEEFYVAARKVSAIRNGMATAADWMSGASFVSMAGAVALLGYDAGPFLLGWSLNYVLVAMLIAPFLRKYGKYTIPEFFEDRYYSKIARLVAVIMTYVVSLTYLTGQLAAVGIVMSRVFGVEKSIGVLIAPLLVLLYSSFGGMKSITWTQVAQYIVLITAYWLPIILVGAMLGLWNPLPHITYGPIVGEIDRLYRQLNVLEGHTWTEPFVRGIGKGSGELNWLLTTAGLMFGTLGLPHILMRFYTVPDVKQARMSVAWSLLFIGLLYLTAPVYAALASYKILQDLYAVAMPLNGQPIEVVKETLMKEAWVRKWMVTGLVGIKDLNHDGVFQYPNELFVHKDIIVLGLPDMYGLGALVAAFVAVGGLSAALSTADGLILAMTTAATHDFYKTLIRPEATEKEEVKVARIAMAAIAVIAGVIAYLQITNPVIGAYVAKTVGWAFAFAAATLSPAIILGIFWKRTTKEAAIIGMFVGLGVTLPYVIGVELGLIQPIEVLGSKIGSIAWGVIGFFTNLATTVVVSLLTPPPPKHIQKLVEDIRKP